MSETKKCLHCGREFSRPSSFSNPSWGSMRYCSARCSNRARGQARRADRGETKNCELCGKEFGWPESYNPVQWRAKRFCSRECAGAARRSAPMRTCPICGENYRRRYEKQTTCKRQSCISTYRKSISGPASAERMRADYAAGKRKIAPGISPREVALWPLLRDDGWVWRLRWIERDAEFELDFAHRELRVNVEVDGVEHREPRGRAKDAARDAALAAQGWRIFRVTNEEVDRDPAAVAARIAAFADSR